MELRPVEAIRAVGPVGVRRLAGEVAPAIAVECTGRMEDDRGAGAKRQDRGLEDEEADLGEPEVASSGSVDVIA